ncbi:MAG: M48 family metalloprotease [Bacteroidota bacterium]
MMNQRCYLYLCFLITICCAFSCQRGSGTSVEIDKEEFKKEELILIGEAMSNQIVELSETFPLLDPLQYKDAYIYVNRLLNSLKLTSIVKHRNDFDWKVTLIHDCGTRTAFALPSGEIFVYTGLLKFLNAEHELMAVLANEMAYADQKLVTQALRAEYGGIIWGDLLSGRKVENFAEIVSAFPNITYDEALVSKADQFAIELVCPFQYDISGLNDFVERASNQQIKWIQSKKVTNTSARLATITSLSSPCGRDGVTNYEQYQRKIKNFLPKCN